MARWVMHVDLDAFYASIEQRDNPDLRGRPVVVGALPGGRGVVATCSYEARCFGVRSAMPIAEAARRLPSETVYVRPRMAHYAGVSRAIMQVLKAVSPVVEKVSIDEAYLDVSGLERLVGAPEVVGRRAKEMIHEAVGLTASVGIGPNRFIAKIASDNRKPDGLTVVRCEDIQAFLDPLPVTVLRGVGVKTEPVLRRLGLVSVADVRRVPLDTLRQQLGAQMGVKMYEQARGIASDKLHTDSMRKSISKETTFDEDLTDVATLRDTLRWAAQEIAFIAREEKRKPSVVTLKIRFTGFETHTRSRTLTVPNHDALELFHVAWALYQNEDWSRKPVRLIGLGVSGWSTDAGTQQDLFDKGAVAAPKEQRLNHALDEISHKFGRGSIQLGLKRRKH